MKTILNAIILLILFSTAVNAQQCDTAVIIADTATFRAMLDKHDGILIDVRTPEEWETGYISGAINIDYRSMDFEQQIAQLDTTKTYYVYCELGGRSMKAAEYMLEHGFCRVINLESGLNLWRIAGYPLVKPDPGAPNNNNKK